MAEAEASQFRNGYKSNGFVFFSGPRPSTNSARECSYSEFLKYKPLDFKGTEELFSDKNSLDCGEMILCLAIAMHDGKSRSQIRDMHTTRHHLHGGISCLRPLPPPKQASFRHAMGRTEENDELISTARGVDQGRIESENVEFVTVKGNDVGPIGRRFQQPSFDVFQDVPRSDNKIENKSWLADKIHWH
ncbi:hypothetical protein Tco_1043810 [Tanacetum coccineum]|uniref:Uncharacterized protein n=1 Tax=Tanacetum coccineum TaxID=301880 RepID=A0ABQ5GP98_9ASTR